MTDLKRRITRLHRWKHFFFPHITIIIIHHHAPGNDHQFRVCTCTSYLSSDSSILFSRPKNSMLKYFLRLCGSTYPGARAPGVVMTTSMLLGWWIWFLLWSGVGDTYGVIDTNMRDHTCHHIPNITFPTTYVATVCVHGLNTQAKTIRSGPCLVWKGTDGRPEGDCR